MQRILEGIDTFPGIVRMLDCRKPLLVSDSSYPFLTIKDAFETLDMPLVRFDGFTPNPLYEQVCKGFELFISEKCNSIIAVGGGSAIDVAKCIKLAILSIIGERSLIPPLVSQKSELKSGLNIPFIAIPTTAGTGAESTHNAVIYYKGVKQTVTDDAILPDIAMLEPGVLKTLPLYQKKCTMMDALCQGIESWWSVNSTDESKEYSQKAVQLIMANWRKYVFDNDDEAAAQIMLAANYSGRAINIAQTTAAHAMSYKITSMYGLPHGHAVAVCLPEIWEYMMGHLDQVKDARGKSYVAKVFSDISIAMEVESVTTAISTFRQMMRDMELVNPKSANKEEEYGILSQSVNPIRLKNNPIELTSVVIRVLYSFIVK